MGATATTRSGVKADEARRRNAQAGDTAPTQSGAFDKPVSEWPEAPTRTGTYKTPGASDPAKAARGADRRRYDRYAVRCECWIESDEASVHGQAADLGMGGVFLRTAVPIANGRHVDVVLVFGHDAQRVRARGTVTRTVPAERGRRYGLGIELTDIFEGGEALEKLGLTSL
jgi:hypothetical protein